MGINLQLLALQALPRLAKKFAVKLEGLSTFHDLYGTTPEEFQEACERSGKILGYLFEEFQISWWDVYLNSDIGMERMKLVKDIGLEKDDKVLDVGCGRGYFTIAAAKLSKRVISLDLMNGGGRHRWWNNFKEDIAELGLEHKVLGLKVDAQSIPLKDFSVSKVVAAHSIRNFQDKRAIRNAICEMYRVLSKKGAMVIAENVPIARNKSQEAHIAVYKCKCKYTRSDLFYFSREELVEVFEEAGLREVDVKIVDYNLSAAPPIFHLNLSLLREGEIQEAQREYARAINMVKKYGETSPPTAIIKATK